MSARRKHLNTSSTRGRVTVEPRGPLVDYNSYGLGAEKFEELCCALLSEQATVRDAERYGRPHQGQFGVDIFARRRGDEGIEVVSCKCYAYVGKGKIESFANEFLNNWHSHWKAKRVKRFILAIPADLRSRERLSEIEAETKRFRTLGVQFHVWANRQLNNLIRRSTGIRRSFFREWDSAPSEASTMPATPASLTGFTSLPASAINQIHELQSVLGKQISSQLDRCVEAMRRGQHAQVATVLRGVIRDKAQWNSLMPHTQARVLRLLAVQAMSARRFARAKQLINRADDLCAKNGKRFRALLVLQQHGAESALTQLGRPSSEDEALLRAALELECDKAADAARTLAQWRSKCSGNAEWRRLMAYVTFREKRRSAALEHIRAAEELAPEWLSVLQTGAILRYGSAISDAFDFRFTKTPEPVHPDFVRHDDDSQALLTEALAKFELLIKKTKNYTLRQDLEVWRLACLSNLVGREKDAERFFQKIVRDPHCSLSAVFWGLTRQYRFPKFLVARRLRALMRRRGATVDELQALLACYVSTDQVRKAADTLEQYAARFDKGASTGVIRTWRARLAMAAGTDDASLQSEPLLRLEYLVRTAQKTNDWQTLATFLEAEQGRVEVLLAACEVLATRGKWELILPYIDALTLESPTASIVTLAAYAWYNTNAFDKALDVLERNVSVFPRSVLPLELNRLKTYATARYGDVLKARALAAELARNTRLAKDQLTAARMFISSGDVSQALPFIREAHAQGLTGDQLLQLVPSVFTEDPELARTLTRDAIRNELDPAYGTAALSWAYKLGLNQEATSLLGRLVKRPEGETGLRSASIEEVAEHIRQQKAGAEVLIRRYCRGEGPIHVVAHTLRRNLARIWERAFNQPSQGGRLFIRSGNRPREFFAQKVDREVTLVLDVTALLTAEWLGILKLLEDSRFRLELPPSLIPALEHLEQDARHYQPSRVGTVQKVVEALETKRILIANATLNYEQRTRAQVVFDIERREGSDTTGTPRITLGALADELVRVGAASRAVVEKVRRDLSGWQSSEGETTVTSTRELVFHWNTIDAVIEAGLFPAVVGLFRVFVDQEYAVHCQNELHEYRTREAVADRVRNLRRRIADGLANNRYQITANPSNPEPHDDDLRSAELSPLRELLALPQRQNLWIWIDDRFATSFTASNGNNLVSTFEVLQHLNAADQLATNTYYELLVRLRSAGVAFLPITPSEVMHWLRAASLNESGVVETPELGVLRKALNEILRNEGDLDLDFRNPARERVAEVPCLLESFRLARECLTAIWEAHETAVDVRLAYSDWTWNALRVQEFELLPPGGGPPERLRLWRQCIVSLLCIGIGLSTKASGEEISERQEFINWLTSELLDLTRRGDDAAQDEIASFLKNALITDLLRPLTENSSPPISIEGARLTILRFIDALPDPIRRRLYADQEVATLAQPKVRAVVELGAFQFEASTFWAALAEATRGISTAVESVDRQRFSVRLAENGFDLSGSMNIHFADESFKLLSGDPEQRRAFLNSRKAQLFVNGADVNGEIDRVATMESPSERLHWFRQRQETTAAGRYDRLRELLSSEAEFSASALLPADVAQHLEYLGLANASGRALRLVDAAAENVAKLGLSETVTRWIGLPVRLSDAMRTTFAALRLDERNALLKELSHVCRTPLGRLKLLELICSTGDCDDPSGVATQQLIQELFATWQADTAAFLSLLRWSERVWQRNSAWRELGVGPRLACVWTHAEGVLSSFMRQGAPASFVKDRFETLGTASIREILPFDADYEQDVAAPKRMSSALLLLQGLSAALGAHSSKLLSGHEAAFKTLVSTAVEGRLLPSAAMFEDRRDGQDAMNSFLCDAVNAWYEDQVTLGDVRVLATSTRDELRSSTLEMITSAPNKGEAWAHLHVIGFQWLPRADRERVEHAFQAISLAQTDATDWGFLLSRAASVVPFCDLAPHDSAEKLLLEWVKMQSSAHDRPFLDEEDDSPASRAIQVAAELAFELARRGDLRDSLGHMARLMRACVDSWPLLAKRWRPVLERILRECSSAEGQAVWPTFVVLRCV